MACALGESSSLVLKADGQHVNERSEIAHTCNWRIPTEIHYICWDSFLLIKSLHG